MRVILSLLAVGAMTYIVQQYSTGGETAGVMISTMYVGFLMVSAWLAGKIFDVLKLPRISGYLVLGVIVGPYALNLIPASQVLAQQGHDPQLRFINDLAIALIALTAGGEIEFAWLKPMLKRVAVLTAFGVLGVWFVVGAAMFAVLMISGFVQVPWTAAIMIALLLGIVAVANSPAVAIAMISEYQAEGPLSKMTLAVTICKDMSLVVVFATLLAVGRGFSAGSGDISPLFFVAIGGQLVGSLLVGALIGVVMAWYTHKVTAHLIVFIIGSCLLIALLGEQQISLGKHHLHLEPLLMALAAGVVMQNLWPVRSQPLFETVESMSLPVYCLFFALAGAKLDLGGFMQLWLVVAILVIVRSLAVWGSISVAGRLMKLEPQWRGKLWLGFIPQAGMALAMQALMVDSFSDPWAAPVANVMLGMVAINELLGPVGFRYALRSTGEVGAAKRRVQTAHTP